eukprot:9129164-Pyramimonas_sp.AAC.1
MGGHPQIVNYLSAPSRLREPRLRQRALAHLAPRRRPTGACRARGGEHMRPEPVMHVGVLNGRCSRLNSPHVMAGRW